MYTREAFNRFFQRNLLFRSHTNEQQMLVTLKLSRWMDAINAHRDKINYKRYKKFKSKDGHLHHITNPRNIRDNLLNVRYYGFTFKIS